MRDVRGAPSKRFRAVFYSWFGRPSVVKMSVLSKLNYRFSAKSMKITCDFFYRN